jgi:hypothetical protein
MISYQAQCPPQPASALLDTLERTSGTASSQEIEREYKKTLNLFSSSRFLTTYSNIFCSLSERLDTLRGLAPNWNSYGSPPPSEVAIDNAKLALRWLQEKELEPENVHASADGGVAFSFVSETISRAAIECLNNGETYVLLYDLRGNSETLDWSQGNKGEQIATIECLSVHLRSAGLATHS